jgi:4-aminobutyrate aminotransferase-like enzyme
MEKAFLVSAGTEAVEVAVKLMRMEAQRLGKRRGIVISFEGNWHGRTMGAQHLSSNTSQRAWIGHEDPDVLRLPFPYPWIAEAADDPVAFLRRHLATSLDAMDATLANDVAGFFLETYQGWGAVFYPPAFVREIENLCRKFDALLVFDEMQAGFARTGKLFGYEHYGVTPDLICCGKGASSSLPLAFVLGRGELLDLPDVGSMSSTHSANPISCAAGLANLEEILNKDLVGRAHELGERFHRSLEKICSSAPSIRCVQGKGMVAALIFNDFGAFPAADVATRISEEAMRRGLLVVHTGRESIKLAPPITIPEEALNEGLEVLANVIAAVEGDLNG